MIERQGAKVIICCDSCDATFDGVDGEEFNDVWASAKREGWSVRKIANEWLHGCPDCGSPR